MAGEQIEDVQAAGLTAYVGLVPESQFGAAALHRNLEDLDWLGNCAAAHHRAITVIGATRAVTPMRLATICGSPGGVQDLLVRRKHELTEALAWVMGRSEWGLKAYVRRPPPTGDAASDPGGGSASPGTAYLSRRRSALAAQADIRQEACESAESLVADLDSMAVAASEHPLHDASLDAEAAAMIVNRSYLVDDSQSAAFASAVAESAESRPPLRVELTGPWPTYSFGPVPDEDQP